MNARCSATRARAALVVLACSLTVGCGSSPYRVEESQVQTDLSNAELAIESATQSGAPEQAAVELFKAKEKLTQARAALSEGDAQHARRLAEQARVDARLAEVRAEAASQQRQVQAVRETLGTLPTGAMAP